jgi:hypothetical protein
MCAECEDGRRRDGGGGGRERLPGVAGDEGGIFSCAAVLEDKEVFYTRAI